MVKLSSIDIVIFQNINKMTYSSGSETSESLGRLVTDSSQKIFASSGLSSRTYLSGDGNIADESPGRKLGRANSCKSRKRHSWKLYLPETSFTSPSGTSPERSSYNDEMLSNQSMLSPKSAGQYTFNRHKRMESSPVWSRSSTPDFEKSFNGSNPGSKRSSMHAGTEQERVLQEKLQEMARSDNARLSMGSLSYNVQELGISDGYGRTPKRQEGHVKHNSEYSSTPSVLTGTVPYLSTVSGHHNSFSASLAPASLAPTPIAPVLIASAPVAPGAPKTASPRWKKKDESVLVMRQDDIAKLEMSPKEDPGPNRPGNIEGTVLSWTMTQDLFKTAVHSSANGAELLQFMWLMFSRPENLKETFTNGGSLSQVVPPKETVNALRQKLPKLLRIELVPKAFNLLRGILCTGFVLFVILIQVTLVTVMFLAYTIGDTLLTPVRYFWPQAVVFSKAIDDPVKKKVLRKAMIKQAKRKRRSTIHGYN